jgi:hypothetical protein
MLMNIHVATQYCENYGTADQPYWKFKSGVTYVLTNFTHPLTDGIGAAGQAAVDAVRAQIEYANPMSEEYIIDWEFKPSTEPTTDEQLELEYDGRISYPSPRIDLRTVGAQAA